MPARRGDIGLPDRAGLLANVALGQGLWARTWLSLASVPVTCDGGNRVRAATGRRAAVIGVAETFRHGRVRRGGRIAIAPGLTRVRGAKPQLPSGSQRWAAPCETLEPLSRPPSVMPHHDRPLPSEAATRFRPLARAGVVAALLLGVAGCASFKGSDGESAPFERLDACEALGTWVEPLSDRYGSTLMQMSETRVRPRVAVLFEDANFVPVFGTPVDALSARQSAAIYRSIKSVRKRCKLGTYLRDDVPLIFIGDVFNPKPRMHAGLTRAFANGHAASTRADTAPALANRTGVDRDTVRRTQRLLDRVGRDVGPIDGLAGERTLQALRGYKRDAGIRPFDDTITPALLARLERDARTASTASAAPVERRIAAPTRAPSRARPASPELQKMIDELAESQRKQYGPDRDEPTPESARTDDGDGSPAALMADLNRLLAREPVRLTSANTPFFAGLSVAIMRECKIPSSLDERARLSAFVASAGVAALGGTAFSSPDMGESVGSVVGANARISAGETAGARLGCGERASAVTDGVLAAVESASGSPGGSPTAFVRSCTGHFSQQQCECLGNAGRSVIPDIHQQIYNRSIVSTITSRNPFVGMQIMATCGITRY